MTLTQEQAEQIKNQLLENLESFPEDQRDFIKKKVLSLSPDELEEFLKQNKLNQQECIFCSIISGRVPAFKIAEDQENISILELNPLSKGHTLIIPKKHSSKIPDSSTQLANQITKKIKYHLKPKDISLKQANIMGHQLIEIVPIYDDKPQEKTKASEKELQELQSILVQEIEEPKPAKVEKEKTKEIPKLPPRIP